MILPQGSAEMGYTLVSSINDLEGFVCFQGKPETTRYAYVDHEGSLCIPQPPQDVHQYVIKVDPAVEVFPALRDLGIDSIGYDQKRPFILSGNCITVPEKYAREGDRRTAPTEEQIEAIPGVLKCICKGASLRGTRWDLVDGELQYPKEMWRD